MAETRTVQAVDTRELTGNKVDLTPYLGTWRNSNVATQGIKQFILAKKDGAYTIQASAADDSFEWGEVEITAYADSVDSQQAVAFDAVYDFGFMESYLGAYSNKGLIVVAIFNKLKDGSGRSDYFTREYFFQKK